MLKPDFFSENRPPAAVISTTNHCPCPGYRRFPHTHPPRTSQKSPGRPPASSSSAASFQVLPPTTTMRAGGRAIVLQYRRLLGARVVTIYTFLRSARRMRVGEAAITWTRAVISCRVNCCRRPVMSGFNITIKRRRLAAAADPATCEFYFYNIDIGDLLTPIRRCSSRLRCHRFLMSDVYIG